jgi:hypothetical protein
MRSLLFGLALSLPMVLQAQDNAFHPSRKYHPDSIKKWIKNVMHGTAEKHPGFYRYTTKERFDFMIDSTVATITDSLTELDFYRKLKPLYAQIGCLHTGVTLSKEYNDYLDKTKTLFPFEVFIDEQKRVFVTKNYSSNPTIPIKGEIITINGMPIANVLRTLLKSIPMDGYNESGKILLLNHRFAFWYQSMIEVTENFTIVIKKSGSTETYSANGVSKEIFPSRKSLESAYEKPLELVIKEKVAVLSIHTFAGTEIKEHGQDFRKFIQSTFRTLKDKNITNLIVDLRYNSGGTDGNAAYLAKYFFDKPFRYWEKIEVTEAIAKEITGMKRLFYKKPKYVGNSYRWRTMWMTHEFDYYELQSPAKNNFNGKTLLLTNGLCMSSCSDLIAILSDNKKALVLGEESGGGFQGNTSGMIPTAKIKTGLRVTIPLQKYTNAVDPHKNVGRGTLPDYPITISLDDWVNKKDVVMESALKLITTN